MRPASAVRNPGNRASRASDGQTGPMSRAGQFAEESDLIDVDELIAAYYDRKPDPSVPAQRVAFALVVVSGAVNLTSICASPVAVWTKQENLGCSPPAEEPTISPASASRDSCA